ncbi:TRAP transporter permease [Candidatus Methylomirabilis sp.]|uniref:TRAP transporter permease n=1 Tax=Candidatus Methylomirabilis sp. TaxID=2032687 RepID=UPI003C796281
MNSRSFFRACMYPLRIMADAYREGQRVKPRGVLFWIIAAIAVPLTAWELWLGMRGAMQPLTIAMVFGCLLFTASFLTVTPSPKYTHTTLLDYGLAVVSLICGAYLVFQAPRYVEWISGISEFTTLDLLAGGTLLLLALELLRRCVGLGLSLVVYSLLAYVFFGHHLTGTFSHREMDLPFFIEQMIISINGGIFSEPIQVAATYAFLFILFGRIIEAIGGGRFFFETAAALTGRKPGGVAKVAVVSSGLFGMISGSPAADVMTTGSVTIPAMRRLGYSARFAGAVESVASTGGSLMPPVMGAVVFLMAEFTGIKYGEIVVSAIPVAFLYYLSVYYQVHLRAMRTGLVGLPENEIPTMRSAFTAGWPNIVPFAILVYFMLEGYTAAYVAGMGVIAAFVISWIKRSTRLTPRRVVEVCVGTIYALAPLVAAVASAGIVIGALNITGLSGKLSSLIFALTGGDIFLSLLVAAIITVILGMGMPVVAVYALVAVLVAPVLVELGLGVFEVHFFLVYYAVLSAITPPIAIACYVASSIAEASPMAIARDALKLGAVAFVIPFMFVYAPQLLLVGPWWESLVAVTTATIGVLFLCMALEGWALARSIGVPARLILAASGLMTLYPGAISDAAGLLVGLIVTFWGEGWWRRLLTPERLMILRNRRAKVGG